MFLLLITSLGADSIRGELWIRADLLGSTAPGERTREEGELSAREETALRRLLEDARWIISGMIYGFDVIWVPPSRERNQQEFLSIAPIAAVPSGDPQFHTLSIVREDGLIHILMEYNLDDTQVRRLEGWNDLAHASSAGAGFAPLLDAESRRAAMEMAIKEAMRSWLRARVYNRPREVRGRVALSRFPLIAISGESIRATVRLHMELAPPRHYRVD